MPQATAAKYANLALGLALGSFLFGGPVLCTIAWYFSKKAMALSHEAEIVATLKRARMLMVVSSVLWTTVLASSFFTAMRLSSGAD